MTARWSPYFANPPFVVVREVRRAAAVAYTNSMVFGGWSLRFVQPQQSFGEDVLGALVITLVFGTILTGVGLWVLISKSRQAARRIDQPLVVVWPSRLKR